MVIPVFNTNAADRDQTPRSVVSDLGLHCLPMFLIWDARYKLVKRSCTNKHFDIIRHNVVSNV